MLKRGKIPPRPADVQIIQDYYAGHKTREEIEAEQVSTNSTNADDVEKHAASLSDHDTAPPSPELKAQQPHVQPQPQAVPAPTKLQRPEGEWYQPAVLFYLAKRAFFHGVEQDVVSAQSKRDLLSGNTDERNAHAAHYDNRAEYMYSFLQVLTAATASFTHGANDVSK